jgi:hypothetical protein
VKKTWGCADAPVAWATARYWWATCSSVTELPWLDSSYSSLWSCPAALVPALYSRESLTVPSYWASRNEYSGWTLVTSKPRLAPLKASGPS